ncbi:MAG: sensor domain-containing diguanylate cyclase [Desulfovibrio sp.]|nr:sensor domain-containing diguanylate cyclase [Desulfovibrio sp.]
MDAQFYRELLDSLAEGVYFVDRERRVKFWNKSAERLSGYAAQEVLGKRCADKILQHVVVLGTQLCVQGYPLAATMEDGKVREAEVYLLHKYGYRVPVLVRATPVRGRNGVITGAVEVFSSSVKDINVLKELEALRKENFTDQLTGIGNRRFAEITLKTLEASLSESGVPFGVLVVNIDHLRKETDAWGPRTTEMLLRMAAQTLANSLRSLDVICRWGDEEFMLLVPITTEQTLRGMGRRQCMLVENSVLNHEGKPITVTASFGGAVSRQGEFAAEVVVRAYAQLSRSKEAGGNCVHVDTD